MRTTPALGWQESDESKLELTAPVRA